jgi:ParB family chromosome partitioning protein
MNATTAPKGAIKPNAYDGLAGMLADGFDSQLTSDASEQMVRLDDIEIRAQVREEMEDDENSLADLGKSLRVEQIQAIVLRPNPAGSAKPFLLVAGERRVRAAKLEGLTELRARVKPMTDEEADEIQFAENIHRKNLTQIEEAKRVQRDLDQLGSVDAVLAKHRKGRPWLSKIMGMLTLPEQTKRLVAENISADVELITAVKSIEKADPEKAKALVDDLKATRGKASAREKVQAVKDEVKPSKKAKGRQEAKKAAGDAGTVATPKDRRHEEPGEGKVFSREKPSKLPARPLHEDALARIYGDIFERSVSPSNAIKDVTDAEAEAIEAYLSDFYEAGKQATDPARIVIEGFRNGGFATDGVGAFALVAYLHGGAPKARFNLLDIVGCLKP